MVWFVLILHLTTLHEKALVYYASKNSTLLSAGFEGFHDPLNNIKVMGMKVVTGTFGHRVGCTQGYWVP